MGSAIGHILCEEKSDRELGKSDWPLDLQGAGGCRARHGQPARAEA